MIHFYKRTYIETHLFNRFWRCLSGECGDSPGPGPRLVFFLYGIFLPQNTSHLLLERYHDKPPPRNSSPVRYCLFYINYDLGDANRRAHKNGSQHELSLEMQTKIENILVAVATFGDRVLPLIHADATARAWFLNEHLLIQAHHWRLLARRVMTLLKQIGLLEPQQIGLLEPLDAMGAVISLSCLSEEYPYQAKLHDAGRRLVDIYGAYGAPVANNPKPINKRTARTSDGAPAKCQLLY